MLYLVIEPHLATFENFAFFGVAWRDFTQLSRFFYCRRNESWSSTSPSATVHVVDVNIIIVTVVRLPYRCQGCHCRLSMVDVVSFSLRFYGVMPDNV